MVVFFSTSNSRVTRVRMDYESDASYDEGDFTDLHRAAHNNNPNLVRELLEEGADPEARTRDKEWAPIHSGVNNQSYSAVQELLKFDKGQVRLTSNWGWTPLHLAVWKGSRGITKLLVDNGADVDSEDKRGFTPLHLAAIQDNAPIAKFLFQNNADTDKRTYEMDWAPIHYAANKGKTAVIKELLHLDGKQKEMATSGGFRALHLAVKEGYNDTVRALFEFGAEANVVTSMGYTALHFAAKKNRTEVANILLSGGADPELPTNDKRYTALHLAATHGNAEVVQILLQHRARTNAISKEGATPLHCAAANGYLNIYRLLLESGADKEIQDNTGRTAESYLKPGDKI